MERYLEFAGVGKAFPGVQALDDISFRAQSGRVLALLGENGAGKSTLLKIMSGDLRADTGSVILNGETVSFTSPFDAIKAGISVIYQERQLIPAMNVMENIFLGDLPVKSGLIDAKKLKSDTKALLEKFGLSIDPEIPVMFLSTAHQQMVEIIKAYRRNSQVVAFDEPTAPLTDTEIEILFKLIGQLRDEGKIIIYVSHRMAEIFQVTDEIVILKDGKFVKTLNTSETDEQELVRSMVGRDIGDTYSHLSRNDSMGDVLLEVKNLASPYVRDVSFTLRRGEIIGFAGLVGSGRTEVMRALFGADPVLSGEIKLDGRSVSFKTPKDAIDSGIALCPEDRKEQGLVLWRSIEDNICMPVLSKLRKGLFLDTKACERVALSSIKRYDIKTPTVDKIVMELSGGNQQKVILGRWTSELMDTKILILDEPTKGIDVGTKAEIYQTVCDFAKLGIGVIFISSELTEVINVADRIIVMHEGHITGSVTREEATEESILALAMAQ
ncbi:MAG: sugar ABC transporter ATP-binding protein [Oscillospiraceae bacterium]|jgi:ABC-type sugar transport system ATPase subunit|nr:sugar ABC transporter ATP-binding protein [Oscillospiraceae bacterium]